MSSFCSLIGFCSIRCARACTIFRSRTDPSPGQSQQILFVAEQLMCVIDIDFSSVCVWMFCGLKKKTRCMNCMAGHNDLQQFKQWHRCIGRFGILFAILVAQNIPSQRIWTTNSISWSDKLLNGPGYFFSLTFSTHSWSKIVWSNRQCELISVILHIFISFIEWPLFSIANMYNIFKYHWSRTRNARSIGPMRVTARWYLECAIHRIGLARQEPICMPNLNNNVRLRRVPFQHLTFCGSALLFNIFEWIIDT